MFPNDPTPEVPEESKDRFKVAIKCMFVEYTSQVGLSEAFNYAMAIATVLKDRIDLAMEEAKEEAERQASTKAEEQVKAQANTGGFAPGSASATPKAQRYLDIRSSHVKPSTIAPAADFTRLETLQMEMDQLKRKQDEEARKEETKRRRTSSGFGTFL